MGFEAKILADSLSPMDIRLTTFELTYPRIVHAEFMTHRMFSRNAASSRAIPVNKLIERVLRDPFIPDAFGENRPGMQAGEVLSGKAHQEAETAWLNARDYAVQQAQVLMNIGVHKQLANRLLEPFQWYTVICTATEWENFFALRCHPDAQPQIQQIAVLMREALKTSQPHAVGAGEWHLPLTPDLKDLKTTYQPEMVKKISAGRCARVSYTTHDGLRDPIKDIELCDRLTQSGHMSPLEHVATPLETSSMCGNFRGWCAMRKTIANEDNFAKMLVTS